MRDLSVLVIGAGMGGLTAALALQKLGFRVKVYEQAPALAEVGAGLTISPNATRALEFVGLGPFMAEYADKPAAGALVHYRTGEALTKTQRDGSFLEQFGAEYYQIHRADLHDALAAAVRANDKDAIILNHTFENLTQDDNGVTAQFENGEAATGDVLIGADGSRSAVRGSIIDTVAPKFTGQAAFRGMVPAKAVAPYMTIANSTTTMGPGHIFTRYYLRHETMVNVVGIVKTEAWKEEGWSIRATQEEFLAEYQGWNEKVIGIIKAIPEDKLYKWALFDRDPIPEWTVGRATLLGDAAHPMLPFLGMGAAMALEDGVVLARCLEKYDMPKAAFAAYEDARQERTKGVLIDSRKQGVWYQTSDPDNFRGFASTGEMRAPLMGYDPSSVPV
ncbi:MAG: FAD-dependent monooxygenase [Rhodospirillaceae bacterium]|nr:FAD-dependent monooxygenase [Rhodospirillaceae bacterium]